MRCREHFETGPTLSLCQVSVICGCCLVPLSAQAPLQAPPRQVQLQNPDATSASTELPKAPQQKLPQLTLEQRADIFMARKSYADAIEYYGRALKQSGYVDAFLWNKLGIAFQQQTNFHQAEKAYKKAVQVKADFAEPLNNLGTIYFQEQKYGKSAKFYRKALDLRPNSASFHLNLGTSYYHLKKVQEAIEEFREALVLDPTCLTVHSSTGTAVQARGADPKFYFYLAKVFASLGQPEEAVRYLRRAFEDGFHDYKQLDDDPDFQKISGNPAYLELIKNPPVPIKD